MVTVLVAPRSYLGERDMYDKSVNLETVAEMLDSPNLRRREYRRGIIARALKKKAASGVQVPDHAMHKLHSDYLASTERWLSTSGCRLQFPELRNDYDGEGNWIDEIRHPDFPSHVWLRHRLWTSQKGTTGMVDLIVSPASSNEREGLNMGAPEGVYRGHLREEKARDQVFAPGDVDATVNRLLRSCRQRGIRRHGTAHSLVSADRQTLATREQSELYVSVCHAFEHTADR